MGCGTGKIPDHEVPVKSEKEPAFNLSLKRIRNTGNSPRVDGTLKRFIRRGFKSPHIKIKNF